YITSSIGTRFQGKVFSLTVGEEHYPIDEGSGTVINDEGGLFPMDLRGATWGVLDSSDTTIVVDTLYMCDTINLSADTYLDTAYYVGDSLYLTLNSGKTYAIEVISGATQVLTHDTLTNTSTLSEGGGEFSITGQNNIDVELDTFGNYVISADTLYAEDGKSLEFDWDTTALGIRV